MSLTAGEAACSIFGLEVTDENCIQAYKVLQDVGLEPITYVNGDPTLASAVSTRKVNMEPWRYKRLMVTRDRRSLEHGTLKREQPQSTTDASSNDEYSSDDSITSDVLSIAPSRLAILDLAKQILPIVPVHTMTDRCFLTEEEIFAIVKAYLPNDSLDPRRLSTWIANDGSWGASKRIQKDNVRTRGRWYNVVREEYRDFKWESISNVQQFRQQVRKTHATIYTVGCARKSNTKEPCHAKVKSVNLQIYKLKKKLLCEDVFATINTSADDPLQSRDYENRQELFKRLVGCSGNTQAMIDKITDSARKVRLVVIDFAGLSTNVADLQDFIRVNKAILEVVVDVGHKVEIYTRYELLHQSGIIAKFNCREGFVKRSQ